MREVPFEQVSRYSSMKVSLLHDNVYRISDMVEKPQTPELALLQLFHFGTLHPAAGIFDILDVIPKGAGGEYQLTDAMKLLAQQKGMIGVDFEGTRYDMGNKLGILQATVETALRHPDNWLHRLKST